jgi:protein-S-isoprenylcysteine O-methyltransferase Ste14/Flp pilus assembly pilin Flp
LEAAEVGRRVVISIFAFLAVTAGASAFAALADAIAGHGVRPWLDLGHAVLKAGVTVAFAIFVARRSPALRRVRGLLPVAACTAATVSIVLLERPPASTATALVVCGEALAVIAGAWMLASTIALGRCFGILPEARGLVTHGPYRFVRHPLYLGELSVFAGLVIAAPSPRNLVLALFFTVGQTLRMGMEERELSAQFPEYRDYALRTRRLIPIARGRRRTRAGSRVRTWMRAGQPLRTRRAEDGQALVEYAFITTIVSIAGIVALGLIGNGVADDLLQIVGGF